MARAVCSSSSYLLKLWIKYQQNVHAMKEHLILLSGIPNSICHFTENQQCLRSFFSNQNICSFRELRHHLNSWRLKLCGPYQWIYILTKLWNTVFIHYLNNNSRKLHTQEQVEKLALTNSNVPQYVRLLWQIKVDYWKLQYLVRCKLYICTFYQHLPLWFFQLFLGLLIEFANGWSE